MPRSGASRRHGSGCATRTLMQRSLYHGVSEISALMARWGQPDSPADHHLRQFEELTGIVAIAAAANPGVKVETVGELLALGEAEIRRQVDDDTSA